MKLRNNNTHRNTHANERKTYQRVEQYYGLAALLNTWETQPDEIQIREHDYIIHLRARVRTVRNYLLHRATPEARIES